MERVRGGAGRRRVRRGPAACPEGAVPAVDCDRTVTGQGGSGEHRDHRHGHSQQPGHRQLGLSSRRRDSLRRRQRRMRGPWRRRRHRDRGGREHRGGHGDNLCRLSSRWPLHVGGQALCRRIAARWRRGARVGERDLRDVAVSDPRSDARTAAGARLRGMAGPRPPDLGHARARGLAEVLRPQRRPPLRLRPRQPDSERNRCRPLRIDRLGLQQHRSPRAVTRRRLPRAGRQHLGLEARHRPVGVGGRLQGGRRRVPRVSRDGAAHPVPLSVPHARYGSEPTDGEQRTVVPRQRQHHA